MYVIVWLIVLPLLAVGGIVYAIMVYEAVQHSNEHAHPDHRPTMPHIMLSVAVDMLTGIIPMLRNRTPEAAGWLGRCWRWVRSQFSDQGPALSSPWPASAPAPLPDPVRPPPPAPRVVAAPAADLDDDEVHPYEVTAINSAPIPPDHAAVMARIAQFEAEDDAAHIAFLRSEGAAFLGYAEAWRSYASTCLDAIGMDPAAVQGIVSFADSVGDTAHDATLSLRQFFTVYQQVLEWAASGGRLPHRGNWITGGT